eukprot:Pgem_evm1s9577
MKRLRSSPSLHRMVYSSDSGNGNLEKTYSSSPAPKSHKRNSSKSKNHNHSSTVNNRLSVISITENSDLEFSDSDTNSANNSPTTKRKKKEPKECAKLQRKQSDKFWATKFWNQLLECMLNELVIYADQKQSSFINLASSRKK